MSRKRSNNHYHYRSIESARMMNGEKKKLMNFLYARDFMLIARKLYQNEGLYDFYKLNCRIEV